MALEICSNGHLEVCFSENDECPVCELHSTFDLNNNSDIEDDRYEKCDDHDCFYRINDECPGCEKRSSQDILDDDYTLCSKHDLWHDHNDCPACEIETVTSKELEELEDECSKLSEELEEKLGKNSTNQKRGYEFLF